MAHTVTGPVESLSLAHTQITDAELARLKGMRATRVTDAGLEHLKHLSNLKRLQVQGTHVTEPALAELRKALPSLATDRRF